MARLSLMRLGGRRRKVGVLVVPVVAAAAIVFQPAAARAGTGTFRNGKFNFCVSVRFNATAEQLQRIREVFSVANQILADATDGQHQFGTISIINNSGASDQAEFWIHPEGIRANASGSYGARGQHVNLSYPREFLNSDTVFDALTVVHEFAHLAYGVMDEYMKPGPGEPRAKCPGDDWQSPTLSYCIMDNILAGTRNLTTSYSVNEFCVDSNHDKIIGGDPTTENDTVQSKTHNNDSCWETMSKLETKWRLMLPNGLPQNPQPSVQPVDFNTTCMSQNQRVVLVIDRSGSMSVQERLKFAKIGAFHFANLYGAGDQLGIVSFSTSATVNFPLTPMDAAARTNAQAAVNSLSADGQTNIADGLLAALSQLNSGGSCTDCQKTIILLSDGDSNVGIPPESLIQTLQSSDVKVIAATIGTDISIAGERSLKTISNQTGGGYFRGYRPTDFLQFLVQLAFGTAGYRGVANEPRFIGSSQTTEIPVIVEPGAASTYFGIAIANQTDNVTIGLRKPSGAMVTESNAPTGQFTSNAGLKLFKIPTPEAGTWTMIVTTGSSVQSASVEVFSYAQHDGTDFWASIDNDDVLSNEAIKVHGTPTHNGRNVVGASVSGQVIRPDGSQVSIILFDDGLETHADLSANDGTYSALFDNYNGAGTYTFNLKYQNSTGQTYAGEPLPNANGVVENVSPTPVTPVMRIARGTAVVGTNADRIWFDDTLPEGATPHADGDGDWYWVDANPGAFSGTKSHQSRNFGQVSPPSSFHQHYFEGATTTLAINTGDKLFTYVFLDINHMPREIMLQWKDANGWEHRAYWGEDLIDFGTNFSWSRFYMGRLPKAGTWVRLEVPASFVGLEGTTVNGMAFTLDGGRATFDLAGKIAAGALPPPPSQPGDSVWIEDDLPPGSVTGAIDDNWTWVTNLAYRGQRSHQTRYDGGGDKQFRSHFFTGAHTPMQVNPGDVLFTYVWLGNLDSTWWPYNAPDQIMLQWYDGTSWEHRAYWGVNFIGRHIPNNGLNGTEGQRFMGGIPPYRGWYRLEVPASYVGLEGKSVSGMAFTAFRWDGNPFVAWDRSGKAPMPTSAPRHLTATSGVWRSYSNTHGWAFETLDVAPREHLLEKITFYVYPNQAAGTVPMHRFRKSGDEYFYTKCRNCPGPEWIYEGIAFYVYPDASSPGRVPLYLYHDSRNKYFLTVNQNEAAGMFSDGIAAYLPDITPVPPTAPTFLEYPGCALRWRDNSSNEVGFKIERLETAVPQGTAPFWNEIGTVLANTVWFKIGCQAYGTYRVRAYNAFGNSAYSNEISVNTLYIPMPAESASSVSILSPQDGAVVGPEFNIRANTFDEDGNGTIVKVEFFANGTKLGEVTEAPYVFLWSNAPPGTYSLTAVTIDAAGVTTTSDPVNVTVGRASQAITFDPIADKTYGDPSFAITAQASSGLPVSFTVVSGPATVSGNSVTITGAGTVTVGASQSGDANYNAAADVDVSFNVAKASATISLSNLNQTFNGSAKTATATTTPDGLSGVSITYDGSATPPTNAGTYTVVASLTNNNYSASNATGTLTVAKASATISLSNLSFTYDGTPKAATAVTNPAGVAGLSLLYNGSTNAPVNVGSYSVVASLVNGNYTAADVTGTLTIAIPVPATGVSLPGVIQVENFDEGGEGVAYHDTTSTNDGGYYRASGVDICSCGSPYGHSIGWTMNGEWLKYKVNVAAAGLYRFDVLTATIASGSAVHIEVDGVDVTGQMVLPDTGAWGSYATTSSPSLNLTAGQHVLKLSIDTGGFLIDSISVANLQTPYSGTPISLPGVIQVENFDNGVEGVAYHDTTATNDGGYYRTTGVDICTCGSPYGYSVGWTMNGEWLEYTVNVAATGTYRFDVLTASIASGSAVHIEVDGVDVTGQVVLPNTGAWGSYATTSSPAFNLTAGQHVLKLSIDVTGFLIDSISVVSLQTPYSGTPISLPGVIQVENFDNGGEGFAYHDTTASNDGGYYRSGAVDICTCGSPYGYSIGWTMNGEWLEYTVNVAATGNYRFDVLTATVIAGTTLHIEVDGVDVTGQMSLPNTGAWGSYATTSSPPINLTAGQHVLKLSIDNGGYLIDSISAVNLHAPYGGTAWAIPGKIEAENFDTGAAGLAYYDTTPGSHGQDYEQSNYPVPTFRQPTDVDMYKHSAWYSNGYLLLGQAGDWTKYTVNVATSGTYTFQSQVAWGGTSGSPGTFRIEVDGVDKTGPVQIPDTNWGFTIITRTGIQLTAGIHVMRIVWATNAPNGYSGDIDYVNFTLNSAAASPAGNSPGVTVAQLGTPRRRNQWQDLFPILSSAQFLANN
ncbi:MAG TPA: carbohydrate-binding protein [Pyrinomonadaceae bacterium]|nr:carbohydrate-binding protein [Pyrinomonadaceae bacterium]